MRISRSNPVLLEQFFILFVARFYPITRRFLSQDIIESSYINLKFKFRGYRKDIYVNRMLNI